MNEFSTISWAPVGSYLYTVKLIDNGGTELVTITDVATTSIPATDLLLDINGVPNTGVVIGGSYRVKVRTQSVFGNSVGTLSDPAVLTGPADTISVTIT